MVMTETKVRLGRRYLNASNSSKGSTDMGRKLESGEAGVN
jgi:hypothetical protein